MSSLFFSILMLVFKTTFIAALTHYPPANTSVTDLNAVLNGHGAPGIYNTSYSTDEQYGEYNWCAMPHVRKTEYKKPSAEYQLEYVEIIQRHRKRTPYASNTFFKEDIPWDCKGEGPYAYGKDKYQFETTPVYWQAQRNTHNPFEYQTGPGFINSTCQFPALTSQGLEDAKQHGEDVQGVYGELLQFLPLGDEKDKYKFRVTTNVITSQTMSGFTKGIFPNVTEYTALVQNADHDSLEPTFECPMADQLLESIRGTNPIWVNHLTASAQLAARFRNVSGIEANDTAGWNSSWDHPYDNLSAKQCHQKSLPCSVNNTALCFSQEDTDTVYRLGNWEYAYTWRGAENSTLYSVLRMGPWFRELRAHMQGRIDGTSDVKYFHNFAHDGSISPVLGLLQIDEPVWPGMGSEVVFELWKKSSTYYIRVLWKGQPLKTSTPLGTLDMIPLEKFDAYLDGMIPEDLVAACNV